MRMVLFLSNADVLRPLLPASRICRFWRSRITSGEPLPAARRYFFRLRSSCSAKFVPTRLKCPRNLEGGVVTA
jgi:hypothetical protein